MNLLLYQELLKEAVSLIRHSLSFLHRLCTDGLRFAEVALTYSAQGAYPIFWQVFKGRTGLDAVVGITYCGVVLVTADVANILLHSCQVFLG